MHTGGTSTIEIHMDVIVSLGFLISYFGTQASLPYYGCFGAASSICQLVAVGAAV